MLYGIEFDPQIKLQFKFSVLLEDMDNWRVPVISKVYCIDKFISSMSVINVKHKYV